MIFLKVILYVHSSVVKYMSVLLFLSPLVCSLKTLNKLGLIDCNQLALALI